MCFSDPSAQDSPAYLGGVISPMRDNDATMGGVSSMNLTMFGFGGGVGNTTPVNIRPDSSRHDSLICETPYGAGGGGGGGAHGGGTVGVSDGRTHGGRASSISSSKSPHTSDDDGPMTRSTSFVSVCVCV